MDNIKIEKLTLGPVMTNCYIVYCENTRKAVIIDPADSFNQIKKCVEKLEVEVEAVLLTHGHFDHIIAAPEAASNYRVDICILSEEMELASDPQMNAANYFGFNASVLANRALEDGEKLEFLGGAFEVIKTPGHTAGSCCYYAKEEGILFSGDTLFMNSYGRTDLPTGNERKLMESLKMLLELPKETVVYPGHGPKTTIANEVVAICDIF